MAETEVLETEVVKAEAEVSVSAAQAPDASRVGFVDAVVERFLWHRAKATSTRRAGEGAEGEGAEDADKDEAKDEEANEAAYPSVNATEAAAAAEAGAIVERDAAVGLTARVGDSGASSSEAKRGSSGWV